MRSEAALTLPAALTSVRRARSFVLTQVTSAGLSPERCDELLLLTSELVTNAVLHGRSELRVVVRATRRTVRIAVHDGNSRRPKVVSQDPDALDGRGLALVDSLASDWGVETEPEGKAVWFELPLG